MGNPCDETVIEKLRKQLSDERAARIKAQAECAALTAACEWVISTPEGYKLVAESAENPNVWVDEGGDDLRVSTDAGRGWHPPQEWEAVQGRLAAMRADLEKIAIIDEYDCPGDSPEKCGTLCLLCKAIDDEPHTCSLATDAGQNVLNYIAAARRLREIIDIRLSVVKQNLLAPYLADVDAADAKLTGVKH